VEGSAKIDYIALSIPAFFALIGLELAVARASKKRLYRYADTLANLGTGTVQQISAIFWAASTFAIYAFLFENYRLFDTGDTWIAWLGLFLGVEFFYYWFHRLSHEVNFLWGAHVVHHQSEDYNLSVALRQATFQSLFSWVFYLPLALAGFPPLMFVAVLSFTTLYQFWIHTRLIGKLGPLEWILNTPSHHRVHHGRNPEYIDRNHGGTLIVWDRLFGTFEEERAEVIYGVTEPVKSWNPVWANFHYYGDLLHDARRAKHWPDKVKIWFMTPGWRPPSDPSPVSRSIELDAPKHEPPISPRVAIYVGIQFLLALGLSILVIFMKRENMATLLPMIALTIVTFFVLGGLLDNQRWARLIEPVRIVAAIAVLGLRLNR
jgi:sterol desaturase/sphingolipid hydroxylase (fatty acid hydroxylase superfamily)